MRKPCNWKSLMDRSNFSSKLRMNQSPSFSYFCSSPSDSVVLKNFSFQKRTDNQLKMQRASKCLSFLIFSIGCRFQRYLQPCSKAQIVNWLFVNTSKISERRKNLRRSLDICRMSSPNLKHSKNEGRTLAPCKKKWTIQCEDSNLSKKIGQCKSWANFLFDKQTKIPPQNVGRMRNV